MFAATKKTSRLPQNDCLIIIARRPGFVNIKKRYISGFRPVMAGLPPKVVQKYQNRRDEHDGPDAHIVGIAQPQIGVITAV